MWSILLKIISQFQTTNELTGGRKRFLDSFLERITPPSRHGKDGPLQELCNKGHSLDAFKSTKSKQPIKKAKRRRKTLTAKQKHDMKIFELKPEEQK